MDWLNRYSAAIQAVASGASLVVAAVLAFLTARYVRLTRDIASASSDQLAFLRASSAAMKRQQAYAMKALVHRLRSTLAELDQKHPEHREMMSFAHLRERDIEDFETLARAMDLGAATEAIKVVVPLRSILGLLGEAKAVNLSTGWTPRPDQRQQWENDLRDVAATLGVLEVSCDRAASG